MLTREGTPVPLTGKCFEVLLLLVRQSPATVSKDELMKTVWPDTFVEESNLTQHVSLLRKALGESPQDRLYIVTVPGHGYRFVAQVRQVETESRATAERAHHEPSSLVESETAFIQTPEGIEAQPAQINAAPTVRRHPSRLWIMFTGLAIVLLGVTFLRLHHSHEAHALGAKDSILLADFENHTGDVVFDGPLREGTAVELGQSPFLDLVSPDSVRETLRFMGRSPDDAIRLPVAREVCERLGAKALISGTITPLGSAYVLGVEAVGCSDGTILAREQAEAGSKEQVIPVLGKAAAALRRRLGESLASIQTFDVPMEKATTPSLDALKAYSLGSNERAQGNEKASIPFFEHAIALDPGFAMAYVQLGAVYRNLGETEQAAGWFKKAFDLRGNLSEREKLHLAVRYHESVSGDIEKATETYEIWSRMYPRDPLPFNGLSARYQVVGQYEKAVEAARSSLALSSHNYVPYTNLATSLLALNRFDEARQVCEQAAAVQRDSLGTHRVLYELAYIRHDRTSMQKEVDWARGTERENDMLGTEASVLIAEGKLKSGRQLFQRSWASSLGSGLKEDAAYSMAGEALAEADMGNNNQARSQAATALQLGHGIDALETAAEALALAGDARRAQALVDELRQRFPKHSVLNQSSLPTTLAAIELQESNPRKAIELLQQAIPYDLSEFSDMSPIYIRGLAYLQARSGKEAVTEFQRLLDHPGIDPTSNRHPLAQLGLARAYALTGDLPKSRKAYEDFFARWSDVDKTIPVFRDALQEYRNLSRQ
jgi:DNA-binding winged helix-turn-helix (wHTH) protein/tetratricopeptide (TPR) repeat protein